MNNLNEDIKNLDESHLEYVKNSIVKSYDKEKSKLTTYRQDYLHQIDTCKQIIAASALHPEMLVCVADNFNNIYNAFCEIAKIDIKLDALEKTYTLTKID